MNDDAEEAAVAKAMTGDFTATIDAEYAAL